MLGIVNHKDVANVLHTFTIVFTQFLLLFLGLRILPQTVNVFTHRVILTEGAKRLLDIPTTIRRLDEVIISLNPREFSFRQVRQESNQGYTIARLRITINRPKTSVLAELLFLLGHGSHGSLGNALQLVNVKTAHILLFKNVETN